MRYFLRSREIAEELANDVLIQMWHTAPSFCGHSTVATWLLGIARRKALDAIHCLELLDDDNSQWDRLPKVTSDDRDRGSTAGSFEASVVVQSWSCYRSPGSRSSWPWRGIRTGKSPISNSLRWTLSSDACITRGKNWIKPSNTYRPQETRRAIDALSNSSLACQRHVTPGKAPRSGGASGGRPQMCPSG